MNNIESITEHSIIDNIQDNWKYQCLSNHLVCRVDAYVF